MHRIGVVIKGEEDECETARWLKFWEKSRIHVSRLAVLWSPPGAILEQIGFYTWRIVMV